MIASEKITIFWFRRDLRLHDNTGLLMALQSGIPVLPVFIFDRSILGKLNCRDDPRVSFIHSQVTRLKKELENAGSSLLVLNGYPVEVFSSLIREFNVEKVLANSDYEPAGLMRDQEVTRLLSACGIQVSFYKDHVVFEKNEILKEDGTPYSIFTPYSVKWKKNLRPDTLWAKNSGFLIHRFLKCPPFPLPGLNDIGFDEGVVPFPPSEIPFPIIENYASTRDIPAIGGTTRLGIHLRFGTISIREVCAVAVQKSDVFLNELIWRDFFISILWHFPHAAENPFKRRYRFIEWRNNETEYMKWCRGETGYPLVDAGMRELNSTGFMHNRVRMVVASFLTKHLLIDWRWGEAYFAEKLLDYELSSNNGNWQWAAGCGCDAAPYFRVFNPLAQQKKFDPQGIYIRKWIPELDTSDYPQPLVDHSLARERALVVYKRALLRQES